MTIDELIQQLQELRDIIGGDAPVILAHDTEGTSYSPLEDVAIARGRYHAPSEWEGEYYYHEDLRIEWRLNKKGIPPCPEGSVHAAFFWPKD